MGSAVANVRNLIEIEGVDNASQAIDKAKKSLGLLEKDAKKSGKALEGLSATPPIDAGKIQGTTQRAGGAIAALTAAMGPAGAALAEVGRSATALGSTAAVLPGPLGLVGAAVIGVAAGGFLLARSAAEANAKLALLGAADVGQLKDALDLDADAAVKVSQALADLGERGLRPSTALLADVARQAERLGKEGADGVLGLVEALKGGTEATQKFEREFGKIRGLIADTVKLSQSLGLNPEALGLAKAETAEAERQAEVADRLRKIQLAQVELARQEAAEAHAIGTAKESGSKFAIRVAQLDAAAAAKKATAIRGQIDLEKDALASIARQVEAAQRLADAQAVATAKADVADAKASATADKRARAALQAEALTTRQLAAVRALNAFDQLHGKSLTAKLATERAILQAKVFQGEAAALAVKEQAAADAKARAEAARAQRQAVLDANLRTIKAKADRDGLQTERERLAILDAEKAKSLDALSSVKGARARQAARLAIDAEYATARAKLDADVAAETLKTNDDLLKTLQDQAKRSADLASQVDAQVVGNARDRAASLADVLRSQGRDDDAAAVERRQAHADHAQALIAIDRERLAALAEVAAGSTDAANVEALADAKRVQAKLALADVERKLAADAAARATAARADAAASLQGPIDALRQLGQLGSIRAGGLGDGLAAITKGFTDLNAAMSASQVKASEVTAAIGGAVSGVASAAIDADAKRTLAAIDADTQRRLSTATTEEERAKITADAEAAKAQAVEAAERRKAGVLAAVEVAKGIAAAASYDFVAAAGHGAAALAFGAIAGGVGGSVPTSGAGGSSTAGGFTASTPSTGQALGSGSGGNVTIIQNFNQPLATKQEIGKAAHGALKSLAGTGTDKGRGA